MAQLYISPTGNDSTGDGSSGNPWATPHKFISASSTGDTCNCATGTYTIVSESFNNKILTFLGPAFTGNAASAIFDGAAADVAWSINSSNIGNFTNIQFQNIAETNTNGGIFNNSYNGFGAIFAQFNFTNCIFTNIKLDNQSSDAGGLFGDASTAGFNATINACLFYNITRRSAAGGTFASIFAGRDYNIVINNSTFNFLGTGANTVAYFITTNTGDPRTTKITNTIIYNGGGAMSWTAGGAITDTSTYDCFYAITSSPTGTGIITSDPLFVDSTNANFELQMGSPCLDTGILV